MSEGHNRKFIRYDDILKQRMKDREKEAEEHEMFESSIYEEGPDGNINKKLVSFLGEDYIVIDEGPDLEELNKNMLNVIQDQNSFNKYLSMKQTVGHVTDLYGFGKYIASLGGLLVWFL